MIPSFTQAEIRKMQAEGAPVPMHQFRRANQSLMRLIGAARAALDERFNQNLERLTRLFDTHAARIEAEVASIRANRDADAKQITKTVLEQVSKQIRQPKDGETPLIDYARIVREVLPYIRVPNDGVSPDPEALVTQLEQRLPALGLAIHDAIKLLPEEDRPNIALFTGLEDYLSQYMKKNATYNSGNAVIPVMLSGAIKNHQASALNFKGAGAPSITVGANGVTDLNFSGTSGTPVYNEDLSSQAPGTTFNLAHTPTAGSLRLFRGGARQNPGAGNDYTLSGLTITFNTSVSQGEIILADYVY